MRNALSMVAIGLIAMTAASCNKKDEKQAAAPHLASHRAVYELSLARANSNAQVTDVSGKLVLEWQDTCEGYTTNQRFLTQFTNTDGGVLLSDLAVSSWESADGDRFRFNVVSTVNGKIEEHAQGDARRDAKSGEATAHFDSPQGEKLTLPTGTLFPTEHMVRLIEAARSGARMFSQPMFDGSFENGMSDVSAFIGNPMDAAVGEATTAPPPGLTADDDALKLLAGRAWPIRMAFYTHGDDAPQSTPDYEFSLHLRANGVASDLEFDYGDFSVGAKLTTIEALPGCDLAHAKPDQ